MKINIIKYKRSSTFGDIVNGGVFYFQENFYIKVSSCADATIAVNLGNGFAASFHSDDYVLECEAELNVRY